MKYLLILTLAIISLLSCSPNKTKEDNGLFDRSKMEKIQKSHALMSEEQFWSLINQSKKSSDDLAQLAENITQNLSNLTSAEIIGFYLREQKLRFDSYTSDLWCAAYIMNGGCSDDGFEYFRCWLIAQGKEAYYKSIKDPDYLVNLYSNEMEEYEFEDLMYVASNAFEQKTKKDIEHYVDYAHFKENEGHYPEIKLSWKENDEESMKKICPQLMQVARK